MRGIFNWLQWRLRAAMESRIVDAMIEQAMVRAMLDGFGLGHKIAARFYN